MWVPHVILFGIPSLMAIPKFGHLPIVWPWPRGKRRRGWQEAGGLVPLDLVTHIGLKLGAPCGLAMATSGRSVLQMEATTGGFGSGEEAGPAIEGGGDKVGPPGGG